MLNELEGILGFVLSITATLLLFVKNERTSSGEIAEECDTILIEEMASTAMRIAIL